MSNFAGKGITKFANVQILSGKSFRSFKSFKGDRSFQGFSWQRYNFFLTYTRNVFTLFF